MVGGDLKVAPGLGGPRVVVAARSLLPYTMLSFVLAVSRACIDSEYISLLTCPKTRVPLTIYIHVDSVPYELPRISPCRVILIRLLGKVIAFGL